MRLTARFCVSRDARCVARCNLSADEAESLFEDVSAEAAVRELTELGLGGELERTGIATQDPQAARVIDFRHRRCASVHVGKAQGPVEEP